MAGGPDFSEPMHPLSRSIKLLQKALLGWAANMSGTGALPVGDEPGNTCGEWEPWAEATVKGQVKAREHGSQTMGSRVGGTLDWGWGLSPQEHEDETGVKRGKQKVFLMSRRKLTCSSSQGSAGLLETDSVNNVLS